MKPPLWSIVTHIQRPLPPLLVTGHVTPMRADGDGLVACLAPRGRDGRPGLVENHHESRLIRWQGVLPAPIVTLCGSLRFRTAFAEWAARLALGRNLVFQPAMMDADPEDKTGLDELHLLKITKSHAILVLDPHGYVGASTRAEIAFAARVNMPTWHVSDLLPAWDERQCSHVPPIDPGHHEALMASLAIARRTAGPSAAGSLA